MSWKRKRRIIAYDLVTRYGPQTNCQRKRLSRAVSFQNEMFLEGLPAFVIIVVQLVGEFGSPVGHRQTVRCLEHERLSPVGDAFRLQLAAGGSFETRSIRSMWRHNGMQRRSAWMETFLLRLVSSLYQAHELAHAVPYASSRRIRV